MRPYLCHILVLVCSLNLSYAAKCDKSSLDRCVDEEHDDIDPHLTGLDQGHPDVIAALKDYLMSKPNDAFPRNIRPDSMTPMKLQGQFAQARFVDDLYDGSKRNGFFFEAGAYDGQAASNTLFFEMKRDWTGILVEANPDEYEKLVETNRRVWSLGTCLSTKAEVEEVDFDAAGIFGGILQEGRIRPGDNLPLDERTQILKNDVDATRKFIRMQCFPFYSILLAAGNPVVDYLSLDIEGAELGVLKSIPWDKVDIRVISIEVCRKRLNTELPEDQGSFTDDHDPIVGLLKSKGYRLHGSYAHTHEMIAFELILVKEGVTFPGLENGRATVHMDTLDGLHAENQKQKEEL